MRTNTLKKRLFLGKETIAHLDSLQMSRIKAMGDNTDSIELDVEPLKTKVSCVEVTCPPDTESQY